MIYAMCHFLKLKAYYEMNKKTMGRTLVLVSFIIGIFACGGTKEKIFISQMRWFNNYRFQDTLKYMRSIEIKYSYERVSDSLILLKMYSYGSLKYDTEEYQSTEPNSLKYRQYYLNLNQNNTSQRPDFSNCENLQESDCLVLHGEKTINIKNDKFRILSLINYNVNIDGDYRLFFNEKLGILAEYSNSGFHALICDQTNDLKNEKVRKELIDKLLQDKDFFPYSPKMYSNPPSE